MKYMHNKIISFKSFQGLLANVVLYQDPSPPTHAARGLAKKWKPWSKMYFKTFEAFLENVVFLPPPTHPARGVGGCPV